MKLTKNELREQQNRLLQLEKYLPTLQLKKGMLQVEVNEVRFEIAGLQKEREAHYRQVEKYSALLSDSAMIFPKVEKIDKRFENIAGIEVPTFEKVTFVNTSYDLFATPPWLDAAIEGVEKLITFQIRLSILEEKWKALMKELRDVSIRVNLFEKILIPRALGNIKKIKVFLGDQQLAAVAQAKVAKRKITCV